MLKHLPHFLLVPLCLYGVFAAMGSLSFLDLYEKPFPKNPTPVIFEGEKFADQSEIEFVRAERERDKYYPWAVVAPDWLLYGLLAIAAGYIGGLLRDIITARKGRRSFDGGNAYFGLLFGPVLMLCLWAFPAGVIQGQWRFRLGPLIGTILLGSLFSELAIKFLGDKAKLVFEKIRGGGDEND